MPIQISRVRNQSRARLGQPHGTVRSVGPVRGGLGYRWLVSPLNHIHLGEAGWTIWEAIHAPFLLHKILIYNNYNNNEYLKLLFFFFFFYIYTYLQTIPLRCLIVNLDKFASCSFVHGCSARIEIKFGIGMCQFGMEHFA